MAGPRDLAQALETYQPVIGLEVHAQLLTKTKLFTDAEARYDPEHPNRHTNAYCFGMPGVLPVLNTRAVDMAIQAGLALGCSVRSRSVFARKQYFYPDLPKGYQISQYEAPLCEHGGLEIRTEGGAPRRVHIQRIHLEEDAGKNIHVEGAPYSLVDLNRAGVPLIEIVSAPELASAAEAGAYLRALRSILVALGVNDGNMEEGSFRCDANVSIRPRDQRALGTRTELKNINSFRYVEQAIEVEILRQARILAEGGRVVQETRLFDHARRETRAMRSKEDAHDYRYFPDPDLPPLDVSPERVERCRRALPELPAARRERWERSFGLPEEHAQAFAEEPRVAALFEACAQAAPELALPLAHLLKGEVLRVLKEDPAALAARPLDPTELTQLVRLKEADKISSSVQKRLLAELWQSGTKVEEMLAREGGQIDDPAALAPLVRTLLAANPKEAAKLKGGAENVMAFFVGQVMRQTKGKAKPAVVQALVRQLLEEGP